MAKKQLLLSAIAVLVASAPYADTFNVGEHIANKDLDVANGKGHQLNAPFKDEQTTKVTNKANINVTGKSAIGIQLYDAANRLGKNHLINQGTINVENGKGVQAGNRAIVENAGYISVANGASAVIINGEQSEFTNHGTIRADGENSKGITVSQGSISNLGNVTVHNGAIGAYANNELANIRNEQTGLIEVDGNGSKGIYLSKGNAENLGNILVSNGGIGVFHGGNTQFANNGSIVSDGIDTKGIYLNAADVIAHNHNIIKAFNGANGVVVNGNNSQFINKANVEAKGENTKAIAVGNGLALNQGTVKVNNGAIGVYTNGDKSNAENQQGAAILVDGDGSKGFYVSKGNVQNKGMISVANGGIGVFHGTNTQFINDGTLNVAGTDSKGIYLNAADVIASNNGSIKVDALGTGVNVNGSNSQFTNNEKAQIIALGNNTKALQIANGQALNHGQLSVGEEAIGVYINGDNGSFTNSKTGVIDIQGKATKGMFLSKGKSVNDGVMNIADGGIGVFYYGDADFTNNGKITVDGADSKGIYLNTQDKGLATNNGDILVFNGATAITNKGTVINKGKIAGEGYGVKLVGGVFINEGEINTTETAISSDDKTNNAVWLKNGSSIKGNIVGGARVDVLFLSGEHNNLDISRYDAIVAKDGNATLNNSKISLEYNKNIKDHLSKVSKEIANSPKSSNDLTLKNSTLLVDFKDSLTNPNNTENPIIDAGQLTIEGDTHLIFNSSDGRNTFNINEALGLDGKKIDIQKANLIKTAVWDYSYKPNGDLIAKKQRYQDILVNSQASEFASLFEKNRSQMAEKNGGFFRNVVGELDALQTADEVTQAMAQMSGGIHGYTVDLAAMNARHLVHTMRDRAFNRNYLANRPTNAWTQDIVYFDNQADMSGLMDGTYRNQGFFGVSEKQYFNNSRLGFVYGGGRGHSEFDKGQSGKIDVNNIYLGGYYNYDFGNNLSLLSNISFVYGHNRVNRQINIGNYSNSLKASYPTYTMGLGSNLVYTWQNDNGSKVLFHGGLDVNHIMQGNINEEIGIKNSSDTNLMVKNTGTNEFSYLSITPSVGMSVQNAGYIFDKKYLIGADVSYETEVGNIKNGKKLNIDGFEPLDRYRVMTLDRENIVSGSVFGQLDLIDGLGLYGSYRLERSKDLDNNQMNLGLSYQFDALEKNVYLAKLFQTWENNDLSSARWGRWLSIGFENDDDSNRTYYSQEDSSFTNGDYASSMLYKPIIKFSLNDKQSKFSYYFEAFHKSNYMFGDEKASEEKQHATRFHAEVRYGDVYSKGRYGFSLGYRNERANKPSGSYTKNPQRNKTGVQQFRSNFNGTYNLGYGFTFDYKASPILSYNYMGNNKGQADFILEQEAGLTYAGFMPGWKFRLGYYREDKWFDHDNKNRKAQLNQLRPTIQYYFGTGDALTFSMRFPLGNGSWYNSTIDGSHTSESYERRYAIDYSHVIAPSMTVFVGVNFLDIKSKAVDRSKPNYGEEKQFYSFRPKAGFTYSF